MTVDNKRHVASVGWSKITLYVLVAVAAIYLLAGHEAHALVVLPYLLIVACPLMHLLMHRGHGDAPHGSARQDR